MIAVNAGALRESPVGHRDSPVAGVRATTPRKNYSASIPTLAGLTRDAYRRAPGEGPKAAGANRRPGPSESSAGAAEGIWEGDDGDRVA